jgi:hypothetical protein
MIPSDLTVLRETVNENEHNYWLTIYIAFRFMPSGHIYIEIKISIKRHPQFIVLKVMASKSGSTGGHNIEVFVWITSESSRKFRHITFIYITTVFFQFNFLPFMIH